jgi:hypothetical protein
VWPSPARLPRKDTLDETTIPFEQVLFSEKLRNGRRASLELSVSRRSTINGEVQSSCSLTDEPGTGKRVTYKSRSPGGAGNLLRNGRAAGAMSRRSQAAPSQWDAEDLSLASRRPGQGAQTRFARRRASLPRRRRA